MDRELYFNKALIVLGSFLNSHLHSHGGLLTVITKLWPICLLFSTRHPHWSLLTHYLKSWQSLLVTLQGKAGILAMVHNMHTISTRLRFSHTLAPCSGTASTHSPQSCSCVSLPFSFLSLCPCFWHYTDSHPEYISCLFRLWHTIIFTCPLLHPPRKMGVHVQTLENVKWMNCLLLWNSLSTLLVLMQC